MGNMDWNTAGNEYRKDNTGCMSDRTGTGMGTGTKL